MMSKARTLILGLTAVIMAIVASTAGASPAASPNTAAPPIPDLITYQGHLLDPGTETPVPDGKYDMVFTIYDDPILGTNQWSQALTGAQGVQVIDGQFTVYLGGAFSPFPTDLFAGGPLWLGVQVGTDPEMTPRTKVTSAPYALRAEALRAGGTTSEDMASTLYKFENNDPSGYALVVEGRFHVQGDAHVEGTLSWETRTGYISVPAAAFRPSVDSFQFSNGGGNLFSNYGANYYASVNLPHGSTVTKVTFYYDDDTASGDVTMTLYHHSLSVDLVYNMAEITSTDGGYGSDYDDTINDAVVDNTANTYYLHASFGATGSDLKVKAVLIEYEFTKPY
jgi:hypothetical protein